MPWVKIDDDFNEHPKALAVGPLAQLLYLRSIIYSSRYLTDGRITHEAVDHLVTWNLHGRDQVRLRPLVDGDGADESGTATNPGYIDLDSRFSGDDPGWIVPENRFLALRLVDAGLWEADPVGFVIHDFLKYNPSREEVLAQRAERAASGRKGGIKSGVRRRSKREANAKLNEANANPVPVPVPLGGGAGSSLRDGELPLTETLSAVGGHAVRFDEFWSLWPWKEGKAKAASAWAKIKPDRALFRLITAGIESYRQSPRVTKPDAAIMLAATWLNQRRWEDEYRASPVVWKERFLAKGDE
jgi:hypothetical protein